MRVLVIQTAFIGDAILASSMLESLNQTGQVEAIDLLVRKGNESIYAGHPFINQLYVWDKANGKYKDLLRILKAVRSIKYDVVFNAQRFASTGLFTVFSNAKRTIGFNKNPFSSFFTKTVKHDVNSGIHETKRNFALLKAALPAVTYCKPKIYPSTANYSTVSSYSESTPYICIAPTSVWYTKQWPAEKWIDFINQLPASYTCFLTGAPSDFDNCENIRTLSDNPNTINLCGKLSLLESAALFEKAEMNYVNDSAPMHLCSGVDAPTTAIYCSTVPKFGFGPLSTKATIIEHPEELACRPCGLHGKKACPLTHFNCALQIDEKRLLQTLSR